MPTITPWVVKSSVSRRTSVPVRSWVAASTSPPRNSSAMGEERTHCADYGRRVAFRGIPAEALDFYARLEADNTRPFWQANKTTFESAVKAPIQELCDELDEYGPFHLFRPYNDLRFAKGKPPYKTAQGAYGEGSGGAGYYVQVSVDGLMVAAGYYAMAKDQLERFREAVDGEHGETIERLADDLERRGYSIGAMDELKSAPRGYPKDHPRIGCCAARA